jgi:hypothetical protein
MAGGPIQLWNQWAIQILILFSFVLQIFLFVFARARRRGSSAVLTILLWLAYLMADSTAVYTLGHLSITDSPSEHRIVVFWAPFLLVHLGSQDTITAYALEDNQLWPRHLLTLGVQASGVSYVLYKHYAGIPRSLRFSTVLMFIVGVIKYMERIWALKSATLDSIRSSIRKPHDLPYYYRALPSQRVRAQERDDEELVLFAQGMLPLCKAGIVNFPVALTSHPIFDWSNLNWNWNWKATFKVVEMELSLMYDILYTKAAAVHTWYGYCVRVFSMLATATVFVRFQLSDTGNCYSGTDVAITYILLVGAFLLDIASAFSALGSTWTCNFLLNLKWSRLGLAILYLRRHVKAAASNRGWSGSIGQFNLLRFSSRDNTKLTNIVAKMMGLEDWLNKLFYSETLVISEDVKELVFKHVWKVVKKIHLPSAENEIESTPYENGLEEPVAMMPSSREWPGFRPELYDDTARRRKKLDDALNFSAELQEMILTWHVFTDVFLLHITLDAESSSAYLNAIKALSNYMAFLVALHPDTIPGFELRSLYEATTMALCLMHSAKPKLVEALYAYDPDHPDEDPEKPLLYSRWRHLLPPKPVMQVQVESSIVISHGVLYSKLMVQLADAGNPDKPAVISGYENRYRVAMDKLKRLMPDLESSCQGGEFDIPKVLALILDTWVRLLILASVRCKREAHAKQISHGSELTTVVWLMEEHASAFFNQPAVLRGYMEE